MDLQEQEDYITLANLVNCFVAITPEHDMYETFRQDIIAVLARLKRGYK